MFKVTRRNGMTLTFASYDEAIACVKRVEQDTLLVYVQVDKHSGYCDYSFVALFVNGLQACKANLDAEMLALFKLVYNFK